MKKVMTGIAAATLALGVLTTNAHGDENDVSPLLAKKAAVYAIMKGTEAKLTLLGQGYTEFFISDAIEIYSYKGDTKWYLFYYAYGTDRLPTWKEMEDAERKYGPTGEVNGGYVRWLYIRATTKMRPGPPEIGAGMPPGIRFRFMAEGTLRTALPGAKEVKFIKAFACRSEVTFFMYEFDVDGERYAVAPWLLHYKKVAELRPEPPLKMSDEYRAKWEEIDSAIPDAAVERSRVVIDEMKEFVPLLGKSVNSYNDISESVPNYYQNGQGAPGNNWGCGTVSAASVAGSYKGKGYDWYGDTDDEWDSYNYGWWILGNKQPVPTQYSLFWYLQQHGNPQLMSFSQLKAGFNDWLKWHMDGETYNKFDLKSYWPWDHTYGLSWTNLKSHVDELAPPVFERVLKTGGEGFYVTVVGYDDEAGAHIIRVFQHLDPLSNHDISKVEPWDLDDLADDYYFGIMFIENPGPKGNPDGASAVSFMEGDADADE